MAFKTTIKVALLTGAAKDDYFTTEATGLDEDALTAVLNVLGNDPGSAQLYALHPQNPTGTGQMNPLCEASSALGAKITINEDGTINYNAIDIGSVFDSLAEGEFKTDTFYYTVRMANGALSTALVTLEIAGANDDPTLKSIQAVDVHDTAADDTPVAKTGTLTGEDVDHNAILTYSLTDAVTSGTGAETIQTKVTDYGTLTLYTQTGAYSFLADPDKIDALAKDRTESVNFTVTVTDEHNFSASQTLTFNLVGTNDTAVITGTATGRVDEDGYTDRTGGTLLISDRDAEEASFALDSGLKGTYGDFTFDINTGVWQYTLRNDDPNVQALAWNEHHTDTLTVTSTDGSDSTNINILVHGKNDAPTLDVPTTLAFVDSAADDPSVTLSSKLVGHDVDNGAVLRYSLVSLDGVALSGDNQIMVSGEGTFTLNTKTGDYSFQTNADYIDTLIETGLKEIQLSVNVMDDQEIYSDTQQIIIKIDGANDKAQIGVISYAPLIENMNVETDGTMIRRGMITIFDPDDNENFFKTDVISAVDNLGTLTLTTNGIWSYTVSNTKVQYLKTDESKTDSFTISSFDGTSKDVTFTINGANDAAIIGNPTTDSVTEDQIVVNGFLKAKGTISLTDADHDEARFQTTVNSSAGNLGTLTLAADGSYTYAVLNADVQYLNTGESKTDSFTISSIDGTSKVVSFTINGVTDSIDGTEGDNTLLGTSGNDTINGLGGNDTIYGNGGFDTIDGGTGNDIIYLWSNTDSSIAAASYGIVKGGAGDDTIKFYGSPESSGFIVALFGGEGKDTFDLISAVSGSHIKTSIQDFNVSDDKIVVHSTFGVEIFNAHQARLYVNSGPVLNIIGSLSGPDFTNANLLECISLVP